MTDKEIINVGDICLYFYDNDNKSISVVEVVKKLSIDVIVVNFLQVFVDDSGNGYFDYLHRTEKTMNVSLKYLHKIDLITRQLAEIERLKAFKSYFDELYGKGLDVANWHLNGALEPFDNFYESALQEMAGAKNDY